jgi:ribose/xylose/arabinose/galactoside ABC-type transport system permease subunit
MEKVTRISFLKKTLRSKAFTLVILLVILVILFTVLAILNDATFFSSKTFISILQDLAVPAFLAIGAGCLIVSGGIDLSQAAVGAMAGVMVAIGISWWQFPWYVAMLLALVSCGVIGAINAFLVNELRMAPFIATMAMTAIIKAFMMLLSTDATGVLQSVINFDNAAITVIGTYSFGKIPATVLLLIIAFIIYGLILTKTKLGKSIYMIGGNRMAARLSGINAKVISYFLFINCSILSGLSGLIYTSRAKQGSLLALQSDQFTGLTAAILGGISFAGGSGGMGGAFVGLLVIKAFNKGMMIAGSSTYLTSVLSGVLLLAALTLDYVSLRRQRKRIGA